MARLETLLQNDLSLLRDFVLERDAYIQNVRRNFYAQGTTKDQTRAAYEHFRMRNSLLEKALQEDLATIRADARRFGYSASEQREHEQVVVSYVRDEQRVNYAHYQRLSRAKEVMNTLLQKIEPRPGYAPAQSTLHWYETTKKRRLGTINELLALGYNAFDQDVVRQLTLEQQAWAGQIHNPSSLRDGITALGNYQKTAALVQRRKVSQQMPAELREKQELALKAIAYARSTYYREEKPLLCIAQGREQALSYIKDVKEKTQAYVQSQSHASPAALVQLEKFEHELGLRASIDAHHHAARGASGIFSGIKKLYHKAAARLKEKVLWKKHTQLMYKNALQAKK